MWRCGSPPRCRPAQLTPRPLGWPGAAHRPAQAAEGWSLCCGGCRPVIRCAWRKRGAGCARRCLHQCRHRWPGGCGVLACWWVGLPASHAESRLQARRAARRCRCTGPAGQPRLPATAPLPPLPQALHTQCRHGSNLLESLLCCRACCPGACWPAAQHLRRSQQRRPQLPPASLQAAALATAARLLPPAMQGWALLVQRAAGAAGLPAAGEG